MIKTWVLLVSVCVCLVNGYYYDRRERRTSILWADIMDRYSNFSRSDNNMEPNHGEPDISTHDLRMPDVVPKKVNCILIFF